MLIGVDFDNTIVSYDALFHRIARERGLIPADLAANKTAIRDHLRAAGAEDTWTALQGEVYGARMAEAEPFPGVREFFQACRQRGLRIVIVSHKTRHPFRGPAHDLHAAARDWLEQHGFFDPAWIGLQPDDVFFELTKAEKIGRIAACGVSHFVDDLPEILKDPAFPEGVRRYLFDPHGAAPTSPALESVWNWQELTDRLLVPASSEVVRKLGFHPVGMAQPIRGGANNRVYRQRLDDGRTVLVKHYAPRGRDGRDRFATERAFYRYAAAARVMGTSSALGWNELERVGVFTWHEGQAPARIDEPHLAAALRFLSDLNQGRARPEAAALAPASEACFSLAAHVATVEARVKALQEIPGGEPIVAEAREFIHGALQPAWRELAAKLRAHAGQARWDRELPADERCISPSDFGFHNCLERADGRIVFFDFEYAGWDDPAKLAADFFCQPERPAPAEQFDAFVRHLAGLLPSSTAGDLQQRCNWLFPVYRVKWACILLNEFTAAGRARREFSLGALAAAERRPRQLARARAMLGPTRRAAA